MKEDNKLLLEGDEKLGVVEKNTRQFMKFMQELPPLKAEKLEKSKKAQEMAENMKIQKEMTEQKENSRFSTLVLKHVAVLLIYFVCWILTPVYPSYDLFMVILSLLTVAAILATLMNRLQIAEFLLTMATLHSTIVFFLTLIYGDNWILSFFEDTMNLDSCSTLSTRTLCCAILEALLLLDTKDVIKTQKARQDVEELEEIECA